MDFILYSFVYDTISSLLCFLHRKKFPVDAVKYFLVGNTFAFGEFAAGDFDIAGKFHLVEKIVEQFGIDEIRCGASVLGNENGTARFADAGYVR